MLLPWVIEGVLKWHKYGDIAQGLNCTDGYAKDVGYELWELFSDAFGEDVNKLNLRWTLIRKSMISNVSGGVITGHHVAHNHVIGSLNVCRSKSRLSFCGESSGRKWMLSNVCKQ
jgi:hypothetical protein